MEPIQIRPCERRRDWRLFEQVPELLHGADPNFVPGIPGEVAKLGRGAHPFNAIGTVRGFLAFRGSTPVGRIAAIVNRTHNEFHGDRTGFFGFFSFTGIDVARPLLEAALVELAGMDRDVVRGPFNPTQNDECGVHVEGFGERPYFMMPYNPPWYSEVYEQLPLTPCRDLLAYRLDPTMMDEFEDRSGGLVSRIMSRFRISVRPLDPTQTEVEAPLVSRLFNESLAAEWNFMPLSEEAAFEFAETLGGVLDDNAILIAEVDGHPAGISIALPDLNEFLVKTRRLPRWLRAPALLWLLKTRRCQRARWAVFGMLPEYRKRGGTLLLAYQALRRGQPRYASGELSWVQDTNQELRSVLSPLGLEPSKRYRIYETTAAAARG